MKQFFARVGSFAVCVACAALFALPVFAAPDLAAEVYFENLSITVAVQADGSQQISQVMDVVLPPRGTGFQWKLHHALGPGGSKVEHVSAGGELATRMAEDDAGFLIDYGNGAASGAHRVTLDYTLVPYDDLEPDADFLRFTCLPQNLAWPVQALQAEIAFPAGILPESVALTRGAVAADAATGFHLAETGRIVRVESTQPVDAFSGAVLTAQFADGTFAFAPLPAGRVVKKSECTVDISNEMVYTVNHRLVVDISAEDVLAPIALPMLEFDDYSVPYRTKLLFANVPVEEMQRARFWGALPLYYTPAAAGEQTVEYSYTLRPARVDTALALRYGVPMRAVRMDSATLVISAPGLHAPEAALSAALLDAPDESRFALQHDGDTTTLTLLRPLYQGEKMKLSAQVDTALYRRGATPAALACVGFAGCVLLLALVCGLLLGKRRLPKAVPTTTPPENVNCAEFGYLLHGVAGARTLAALVLQWAAKGALTIEENTGAGFAGEYIFEKTGELTKVSAYEKELFKAIFACGQGNYVTTVQLRGKLAPLLEKARMALLRRYTGKYALRPVSAAKFALVLLSVLCLALLGF